jgi:CRISPR/Cas system CSM-associated protein Csm3 (group 7 of RAMP superfamily)
MKLQVKLELRITTALLIAGGEMASMLGIDKSTVRDKRGNLLIPASTIKGRLRDECQRILLGLNAAQPVCEPPRAEKMCPQPFINGDSDVEYCPICRIFGSPWRPSTLYFSDLIFPKSRFVEEIRNTSTKIGVSIDRCTRTAKDKTLYYLETSPQGYDSVFGRRMTIEGRIGDEAEAALLYAGIQSLLNIGGSKSVGLGWIEGDKIKQFKLTKSDKTEVDFLKPCRESEIREWLERFRL